MSEDTLFVLTLVSAVGCGLNAGVFFAFSSFVMNALARFPAAHGAAAMQAINVTAVTPLFMSVLFGTAITCLVLAGHSMQNWGAERAAYRLFGSAIYIAGTVLVTILFNVPLNNALARKTPASDEMSVFWPVYQARWTGWNHIRTMSGLAATALLALALR